ncbi:hypothetical protein Hanom_Chr16g01474881 [Helianthus anomalus]
MKKPPLPLPLPVIPPRLIPAVGESSVKSSSSIIATDSSPPPPIPIPMSNSITSFSILNLGQIQT